jgi:hypothetical protein
MTIGSGKGKGCLNKYSSKKCLNPSKKQFFENGIMFFLKQTDEKGAPSRVIDAFLSFIDIESSKSRILAFLNNLLKENVVKKIGSGRQTAWAKTEDFRYDPVILSSDLDEKYEIFIQDETLIKVDDHGKKRKAEFNVTEFTEKMKKRIMANKFTDKDYKLIQSVETLLKLEKKYTKVKSPLI